MTFDGASSHSKAFDPSRDMVVAQTSRWVVFERCGYPATLVDFDQLILSGQQEPLSASQGRRVVRTASIRIDVVVEFNVGGFKWGS